MVYMETLNQLNMREYDELYSDVCYLASPSVNTFLIRSTMDNHCVGYVKYYVTEDVELFIDVLEICGRYQGMGYGRRVVELLYETDGVKDILLECDPDARGFWEHMGFEYINGRPKYLDTVESMGKLI